MMPLMLFIPGEFESIDKLEEWVLRHTQPQTFYLSDLFRSALRVQQLGLADGYLISVIYDNDKVPGECKIFNGALANGKFYIWDPEHTDVYDYYAAFLVE